MKENYRSRFAVREKRYKGENGRAFPATFLFSMTPPLEGIKILGKLGGDDAEHSRQTFAHAILGHFLWSSGEVNEWNSGIPESGTVSKAV